MKNTLQTFLIFCSLITIALSCNKESGEGPKIIYKFTASTEEFARTKALMDDGGCVIWDEKDAIGVFSDTEDTQVFKSNSGDGVFKNSTPLRGNTFFAYYPYEAISRESKTSKRLVFDNTAASFCSGQSMINLPMTAKSSNSALEFKSAAGLLRLTLLGTTNLQSVGLRGNNKELIGGQCYLDYNEEVPVLKPGEECYEYVWCADPLLSENERCNVYFVLPPIDFENGVTIELAFTNRKTPVTYTSEEPVTITRGAIVDFGTLDADNLSRVLDESLNGERDILVDFYNAMDGPHWKKNTNWCSDRPFREWYGVGVDAEGHVVEISLNRNELNGTIPQSFSGLERLKHVSLRQDSYDLEGIIYNFDVVFECKQLESIELGNAWGRSFSALPEGAGVTIPASVGRLKKLKILDIYGMAGTIPQELFDCSELSNIFIPAAILSGTMPSGWRKLKNLTFLEIFGTVDEMWRPYSTITGPIPEDLYDCSKLEVLMLFNLPLGGSISPKIGNFPNIQRINLDNCELTGSLPAEITKLNLLHSTADSGYSSLFSSQNNHLVGPVPPQFADWEEWSYFWGFITNGNNLDYSAVQPKMPPFSITDIKGQKYTSQALQAKNDLIILFQWSSTCPFTPGFHPVLRALYDKYKGKGLEIVSWSCEYELDKIKQYVADNNYDWIVFQSLDSDNGSSITGGIEYYPTSETPTICVYDNKGNMVYSVVGSCDPEALRDKVLEFFGDTPPMYESTDYTADGTVHTIQTAAFGKGIDVVLMGDAYSDRQVADGTYSSEMYRAAEALFSEEPYKSFRDYFNVYYVDVVSKNERNNGETALDTWFGEGTSVGGDDAEVFRYALKCIPESRMDDALIITVINRNAYAGTCYMYYADNDECDYGRGIAVSYVPANSVASTFTRLVSHEAGGHGFAKLADEYYYVEKGTITQAKIDEYRYGEPFGWWKNVDFTGDRPSVKWAQFLNDERYASEGLGAFEGACTFPRGAWRPTNNSIMNDNSGGFNAPSRYAIWYRINKLAFGDEWNGTYEDFVAYDGVNRTPAANAVRRAVPRNSVEKNYEPLAPPVVIRGGWKNATGGCRPALLGRSPLREQRK